jgi:serine phosphatase RsbU (regulator of sigma subunit)
VAHDEEHARLLHEAGGSSAMLVPLWARGRVLGALSLVVDESGRRYGDEDLALAQEIARRGALAIDNARIHEERSRIAATLQASLLPPRLPEVPGLALASRFRASGEAYEVGGDFFDLFASGPDEWTLVMGDVSGKGPSAAAVTALARYTVREATAHEGLPSGVLMRLNEAVIAHQAEGGAHLCTALVATLRPVEGGARLVISSGGHPLPLRLDAGGEVEPVGAPGMLLGVARDADLSDAEVELAVGDALLVYTDGVTETAVGSGILGDEGLAALLGACRGLDPEAMLARIDRTVLELQAGEPRDDVAMIALRVRAAVGGPRRGRPALAGAGLGDREPAP